MTKVLEDAPSVPLELPLTWLGISEPSTLEDKVVLAFKQCVNTYMSVTFKASFAIHQVKFEHIFILILQSSKTWNELRCTTWSRLQNADVNIIAGLLACVLVHSKQWVDIFFHCKGLNALQHPSACSFEAMRVWFSVNHVPRKWAEQLVFVSSLEICVYPS